MRSDVLRGTLLAHRPESLFCVLLIVLLSSRVRAADPILVGHWPGLPIADARDVAVSGNYAYVADGAGGLQVIDISKPADPLWVGGYDTSGIAHDVAVSGDYAYVADYAAGLQVIDVSDPSNPRPVGWCDTAGYSYGVAVSGNYAYVADSGPGLQVIDVSDPSNPQWVGGYDTSGAAAGVAVSGNYAYVADYSAGLQVIDISNPSSPQRVGGYVTNAAWDVALLGNYAYVAGASSGLHVLDVSNPSNPQWVGGYDTSGEALDVALSGNYACVADYDAGLQVIDISSPANPQRVGGYDTSGSARGVAVSGNYAYVADGTAGLEILLIDPASGPPQFLGQPTNRKVVLGEDAGFTVVVQGSPPLDVMWQTSTDGVTWLPVSTAGFTNSPATNTLTLANVTAAQHGWWMRAILNESVYSDVARLSVSVPPIPGRFEWLSVPLLSSAEELTGGMWVRSPNDAYLLGFDPSAEGGIALLYRWDDGTWVRQNLASNAVSGRVWGVGNDEVLVALGGSGGGVAYRSLNRGASWQEFPLPSEVGSVDWLCLRGTADNMHLVSRDGQILRFDGAAWSTLVGDQADSAQAVAFLSSSEGYEVTAWGWGRWDGASWQFQGRQFGFGEVRDVWGVRGWDGRLHLYAVGNGGLENGVRVWEFDQASQSFGSREGAVLIDGDAPGLGTATGIWGSGPEEVYVIGETAASPWGEREGRIYHCDGVNWTNLTGLGKLPVPVGVQGSGLGDVWVCFRDGRLLRMSADAVGRGPAITVDPRNVQVAQGAGAGFEVMVSGTPPLGYQWYWNGTELAGETNAALQLQNVEVEATGGYSVAVSNAHGSVNSQVAMLTVVGLPLIVAQPQGRVGNPPESVVLSVGVSGVGPFEYQWRRNGANIVGATNSTWAVQVDGPEDGGSYTVVVMNGAGTLTSEAAELTVIAAAPVQDLFGDRESVVLGEGQPLEVAGSTLDAGREDGEPEHAGKPGGKSVWYRWSATADGVVRLWTVGSSFDTLLAVYVGQSLTTLAPVAASDDAGEYFASEVEFGVEEGVDYAIAVDGYAGEAGAFVLQGELIPAAVLPEIVEQPVSQTVAPGKMWELRVGVERATGLQWYFNGRALEGQTGSTLAMGGAEASQVGYYQVRVGGAGGALVWSQVATVEIGSVAGVQSVDKYQEGLLLGGGAELSLQGGVRPMDGGTVGFLPVSAGSIVRQVVNNVTNSTTQPGELNLSGRVIGSGSRWLFLVAGTNGVMEVSTEGSERPVVLGVFRWTPTLEVSTNTLVASDYLGAGGGRYSEVRFNVASGEKYVAGMDTEEGKRGVMELRAVIGMPPWGLGDKPRLDSLAPERRCGEGEELLLSCPVLGTTNVTVQWLRDGREVAGAVGMEMVLGAVTVGDGGSYSVRVSNGFGEVEYAVARVVVEAPVSLTRVGLTATEQRVEVGVRGSFGQRCVLQRAIELGPGAAWTEVVAFTNLATGSVRSLSDDGAGDQPRRYYRVRVVE